MINNLVFTKHELHWHKLHFQDIVKWCHILSIQRLLETHKLFTIQHPCICLYFWWVLRIDWIKKEFVRGQHGLEDLETKPERPSWDDFLMCHEETVHMWVLDMCPPGRRQREDQSRDLIRKVINVKNPWKKITMLLKFEKCYLDFIYLWCSEFLYQARKMVTVHLRFSLSLKCTHSNLDR